MSNGGPWGGGGDNRNDERGGPRKPNGTEGNSRPEIDDFVKKGQEQLRLLMGGRSRSGGGGGGPGGASGGSFPPKQIFALGALVAIGLWAYASFYSVRPEERSVELFFGEYSGEGVPGLNFAPWPFVRAEIVQATGQQTIVIGSGSQTGSGKSASDSGLMLTRDQNIVDIEFEIVWNVSNPKDFLFNLEDHNGTIRAVAESAMRDIIARSELAPILNRDRGAIADALLVNVQETLDSYQSGIRILRVNFKKADAPEEVINSFREVQAAQQERVKLQNEADGYANKVTAGARGEAARLIEDAEAYRAQVVNDAQGEASRFLSVYAEYVKAPEITRRRMYLETMEQVLGKVNKVILDGVISEGGQGVLPYLPLNELNRNSSSAQGTK